jgi:hypothetical protein
MQQGFSAEALNLVVARSAAVRGRSTRVSGRSRRQHRPLQVIARRQRPQKQFYQGRKGADKTVVIAYPEFPGSRREISWHVSDALFCSPFDAQEKIDARDDKKEGDDRIDCSLAQTSSAPKKGSQVVEMPLPHFADVVPRTGDGQ